MARPLRIEFAGAHHHVMSRGNAKQTVFHAPGDFAAFTDLLAETCQRFRWHCHAHCLMGNHYHLLVETHEPTLARGMKHLNGVFTQRHNALRKRVGHLFQGRYRALLVDSEVYLLTLARYIVLNPVRAGLVARPEAWRWSSYTWLAGAKPAPDWADPSVLWGRLHADKRQAAEAFSRFVAESDGKRDAALTRSGILGSEVFVRKIATQLAEKRASTETPRAQRFADRPALEVLLPAEVAGSERDARIRSAVLEWAYPQVEVARLLGLSAPTVSRIVRRRGQVFTLSPDTGVSGERVKT